MGEGDVVWRPDVPVDPWRWVRLASIAAYGVGYAWWFRERGIIIDRISVVLSLTVLLVLAHLGRPWYRWRRLVLDLTLYSAMWLAYEETRGAADRLGMPIQVESVRNIDRALFLGADPPVWLQQRFYTPGVVRWYDVAASVVYYTHFVVPVALVAVVWIADRRGWIRLMRRFATILAVACVSFVVVPTAPPWMAAGGDRQFRFDALEPLARPAGRGWQHLGLDAFFHAWETGRDWVNRVAAMPSLHAGFSLMVVLVVWAWLRRPWMRLLALAYPVAMGLALVYLAEHYVIDVLAGWLVVVASFALWDRIEGRRRAERADRARRALHCEIGEAVDGPALLVARRRVFVDGDAVRAAVDPAAVHRADVRAALGRLIGEAAAGRTTLVADELTVSELAESAATADIAAVIDAVPVAARRRDDSPGSIRERVMVDEHVREVVSIPRRVGPAETP